MTKVLVVDNYDSFTWNLVHLIGPLAGSIEVVRNDEVTVGAVQALAPDAIVVSPGPCTPTEAGISLDIIREVSPEVPTLGVCLGLQAIGQAFGGAVVRAPAPMHGKVDEISHRSETLFRGINGPFRATRYHSLVVAREGCPEDLAITAETRDGCIMGLSHRTLPIHGVQFHPESVSSEHGRLIVENFLDLARRWNTGGRDKLGRAVH
ncbi:anthranilate synthase component II [Enterovirga sp. CN4-39]|uniref:anthranilate synthase component II n=1 Tax=Enterovirga sp. CN4-39 TaxID=3400910 RepID=UPI003C07B279